MTATEKALITSGQAADAAEAAAIFNEMRYNVLFNGENPEGVLMEYGLEPDYFFDLL